MLLLAVLAAIALVLAAVGTYGVIAYLVNQGAREIGIRIALGATPAGILGLVVWRGMGLALAGVALGLGGALVLTRSMDALLFGVGPTDPATFGTIALILIAVALLASVVPARRAANVDPMISLRVE
jgi:putative ABC transport system permease protein